jgi:hypothetical protein
MGRRTDLRRDSQTDNLRMVLAQEAARLIRDHGIEDFRTAKGKAAEKLGYRQHGALPSNREIQRALDERNRIFGQDKHRALLISLRQTAALVMQDLRVFSPCLVGPVLSGSITEHSSISLHVFSDAAEAVGVLLDSRGIPHFSMARKHRMSRDRLEPYPGFRFYADDFTVETAVFPERRKAHAPLCPVNGRPMKRANLRDVEALALGLA